MNRMYARPARFPRTMREALGPNSRLELYDTSPRPSAFRKLVATALLAIFACVVLAIAERGGL